MRAHRPRGVVAAVPVTVAATLAATLAVPLITAGPAAATARPGAGSREPAWQCRTSRTSPAVDLTATATVCIRYRGGVWRAGGSVRLEAGAAAVSGVVGLALEHDPGVDVALMSRDVTVRPGRRLVVPLSGSGVALRKDRRVAWTAVVTLGTPGHPRRLPVDGRGVPLDVEGRMSSPWVARGTVPARPSMFRGRGAGECGTARFQRVGPSRVTGVLGLCLRQQGSTVIAEFPHFPRTGAGDATASVTVLIDGRRATVQRVGLPSTRGARTDTGLVAPTTVQVRGGERRAVVEVGVDGHVVRSPVIGLRG